MPQPLYINDFSAGWIPQDDPINGRKNGLLKMDSLELDQNGAVTLTGGIKNILGTNYVADAHSIYSKFISGIQHRYLTLTNGDTYRDSTQIVIGGSTTRTAFAAAFNYVFIFSDTARAKDTGATASTIGIVAPAAPAVASGGAGILTGDYEYAQLNIFNHGNGYVAQSKLSPLAAITVLDEQVQVTPDAFAADMNEAWIFRRGGTLDQFYRVATVTSNAPFNDNTSDQDVLDLNITTNIFLEPTDATGLPGAILEVVGLMAQRFVYFTPNSIVFSEPNSPDNYDTRYVMNYGGNQNDGSEIFLWARKLSENLILIGTTVDVYTLSGTFVALPDGFIDVYLRALGTNVPPLWKDCAVYNNTVVYMSDVGWIQLDSNGNYIPLCPPTLDKLYKGKTIQGYNGIPIYIFPATDPDNELVRYPCAVGRNKLWACVPGIVDNSPFTNGYVYSMQVYDFIRKSWRPLAAAPLALYAQEDGAIMGFFSDTVGRNLRELDNQFTTTNAGGNCPFIRLRTPFYDMGQPFSRKEPYTLKLWIKTACKEVDIAIYVDGSFDVPVTVIATSTDELEAKLIDLSEIVGIVAKNFAIEISGNVSDFVLAGMELIHDAYPDQLTSLNGLLPIGNTGKAKLLAWSFVMNTGGNEVFFYPIIDGIQQIPFVMNSFGDRKRTVFYYADRDLFGVDIDFKMIAPYPFELWKINPPQIVNLLPNYTKYWQIGPEELFQYGKLRQLFIRLYAQADLTLPYTVQFDDNTEVTGTISVTGLIEKVYELTFPKTTAGAVVKIIFGPSDCEFCPYYVRLQVMRSGKDTENEYVILPQVGPT